MFAPTVNSYKRYQPESWAPTALAWGRDNRTCGFRLVGHGQGFRIESRIPGADCNPYLAFAATIAAGLARHREQHRAAADARGQRLRRAPDVPHVPWNIVDAIAELERSEVAAAAFGDDVHQHLVQHRARRSGPCSTRRSPTGSCVATSSSSEGRFRCPPSRSSPFLRTRSCRGRIEGWIDAGIAVPEPYLAALKRAGAQEAVLMPEPIGDADADDLLDHFDGLLLLGGPDLDPETYGQEPDAPRLRVSHVRDAFELTLLAGRDRPRRCRRSRSAAARRC